MGREAPTFSSDSAKPSSWVVPICLAGSLALAALQPAEAQMLDPEPRSFTPVSQEWGPQVLWSNPAALGVGDEGTFLGLLSFVPNPGRTDAEFGQAVLGTRMGPFGLGVRRERLRPGVDEETIMGTGVTIGVGFGGESFAVGALNDQYRRGITSSRWELGVLWKPLESLTLGGVWRDIGSPVIIAREREQSFTAGATVQGLDGRVEGSLEVTHQNGGIESYRSIVVGRFDALDVLAGLDVDSGGSVRGLRVGLGYSMGGHRGFGVVDRKMERVGGDASGFTLGGIREMEP